MLVIELNQGADVAAKPGRALGSHVLPLAACFGAHRGQAQPADVPGKSLPPQREFGVDFYLIETNRLPSRSGKRINNNESTGMHLQWLP